MPLNKVNHIIQSLTEMDDSVKFDNLICLEKKEEDYSIYIFSIQIQNEEELLKVKDELRDYIAIYFQSQMLEKEIERWNFIHLGCIYWADELADLGDNR